jgi:hypothetical protein
VAGSRTLLLFIILLVGIGGYAIGLNMARQEISAAKQVVQQLQTEGQKLKKQAADLTADNALLQAKVASIQVEMEAMKPTQDAYEIKPNESIVVAHGQLTIGLIGTPADDSINININGARRAAVPGDVIGVAPDPKTNCQVTVQSFDMFHVRFLATCVSKP